MPGRRNGSRGSRRPRRRVGGVVHIGTQPDGVQHNLNRNSSRKRGKDRRENHQDSKRSSSREQQHPENTYKTEMCNNWVEFGSCRYNEKCRFAHGEDELRVARRINSEKKWKSELCRNYHSDGTCLYGRRCHFIHEETAEELAKMHATQKRLVGIHKKKNKRESKKGAPEVDNSIATKEIAPSSAPVELVHRVAHINLGPGVDLPSASSAVLSSTASSVPSPIPVSRKRSLQKFCELVGLPIEETNPNEAAEAEGFLGSSHQTVSDSTPFFMRPQAAFGHMHSKIMYEPKNSYAPAELLRTPPKMERGSPATYRVRLPVFKRIASDTGVPIAHPQSPVTTCP